MHLRLVARIEPPLPNDELITAAIGPSGEAVTLWGPADLGSRLHARSGGGNGPTFAVTQTEEPWSARIAVTWPDGTTESSEIRGMNATFPTLQPLPGAEFLIVGARCQHTADGPEHNAAIIGPDGRTRRSGVLGDGIASVQATSGGRIIASYYDEGIFGNFGWGGPGGPDPIGQAGLAEFDTDLRPVGILPTDGSAVPDIADCYALNVTDDDVWACYYTDFPIVRLRDRELSYWHNDLVSGAHHLLVHEATVAFIGGYHLDRDTPTVATLHNDTIEPGGRYHLNIDGTRPARTLAHVGARGSRFHQITTDGHWHSLDLADLEA